MNITFNNKVILVTGACGTVGREIVRQLFDYSPSEIRALDNNESGLFMMNEYYKHNSNFNCYLADVRDANKIKYVASGVDIILHCAALKHVFFYEYHPFEAVQTNIIGVKNIIEAALERKVKLVLFTSSDKAVNPTNVMGTSKLMGERLITAANVLNGNIDQRFSSIRFGNVMGSRGSVLQVFQEQIKKGGPVTITDRNMTRFIMTIERAAQLVLKSAMISCGGEVMVPKMQAIRIINLAEVMIELLATYYNYNPSSIEIEFIGAKAGEKLYEELISQEEVSHTIEIDDMFVVLPAFRSIYKDIEFSYPGVTKPIDHPYISREEPLMSNKDIKYFMLHSHLLPTDDCIIHPKKRGKFFKS